MKRNRSFLSIEIVIILIIRKLIDNLLFLHLFSIYSLYS